eukprot:11361285-Ditylum_brightwellii.AAC.1
MTELKGRIYNFGYVLHASCFVTITRDFAKYANRTCSNAGSICLAILNQEDVVFKLLTMDLYPDL